MTHYIALIHEEHGAYGILFPDFPGCVSAGESFDDVVRSGAEALAFHVAGLRMASLKIKVRPAAEPIGHLRIALT